MLFSSSCITEASKSSKNTCHITLCSLHEIEHKIHSTVLTIYIPYGCAQETSMPDSTGAHKKRNIVRSTNPQKKQASFSACKCKETTADEVLWRLLQDIIQPLLLLLITYRSLNPACAAHARTGFLSRSHPLTSVYWCVRHYTRRLTRRISIFLNSCLLSGFKVVQSSSNHQEEGGFPEGI